MGERFEGDDPAMGPRTGGTVSQRTSRGIDGECLHAVLDHPRRRQVLDVVTDVGVATTRDIATQIAAREEGVPPHAVDEERRRDVTVSLYHIHIPKLAEAGVLQVEGMERIRPGPKAEAVAATLGELFPETDADDGGTSSEE